VRALNTLRLRLARAASDADTPPYVYTGLKREHLLRTGSVVLHELYFAGLGGDGKAGAALRSRIAESFGTHDAWETEFRKIAMGLAGGSGWVMLGYNRSLGMLENYWMADHATAPANTTPLLVLDMYEHAFALDYGAAAARYVDAWFANIQWDAVTRKLEGAA
jgi:superoxide dismutase, Fe-Mn family